MNERKYDIHERIFEFVIAVIKYLSKIPKTSVNLIFIGQCTRSVTSMGANDQEADGTSTKKDFVHKYTDVRKENKETNYWLKVIIRTNDIRYKEEGERLIKEGNEIVAIISTIIKNASKNGSDRK